MTNRITKAPPPNPVSGSGPSGPLLGNAPVEMPDCDFWLREYEWQLLDAALLLHDTEPRSKLGRHLKALIRNEYEPTAAFVAAEYTVRGQRRGSREAQGNAQR